MGFADFFVGLHPVRQPPVQHRMCFLLFNLLPAAEKEAEQQVVAPVTAGVVLPRGFSGFAVLSVGRGPAPDANGGQVAVRVGMCGSAHAHPDAETQAQCSRAGVRQRRVAALPHQFERAAGAAQTAFRLLRRRFGLPVRDLFRPLLPDEGSAEWDLQRRGEGACDQTEETVQLCLSGGNIDQLLWQL